MTGRTLVLLRHAKAEQSDDMPDIDRPLTTRGHADAAAAGAWLVDRGLIPDVVICSPSRRTRQTWHAVAVAIAGAAADGPTVHYERRVYDGRVQDLLRLVRALDDKAGTALLIGHNLGISQLSALLGADGGRDSEGLRTAGLAVHRLPGPWSACGPAAELVETHTARG